MYSPKCSQVKWALQIYPNGNYDGSIGYISVCLKLLDDGPIFAKAIFAIQDLNEHELIKERESS